MPRVRRKDPTQTLTIRRRAYRQISVRFNKIKKSVIAWIKASSNLITTNRQDFQYVRDEDKVAIFNEFLQEEIDREILAIEQGIDPKNHWLNIEIGAGYDRGAAKTRLAGERLLKGLEKIPNYSPLANPKHAQRAQLIFTRAYEDLKGVTEVMSKQMSRELSNGILNGKGINEVARNMVDRVDKIGITRARLIARTEIVESHNQASIQEATELETLTGEKTMMEWKTSIDGRERDTHRARHKQIYTREEAQGLIGEPNCRCSISLYVDVEAELKDL